MDKKTYEVIEESSVVNLDNQTVKTLKVGEKVSGEFVLIDEQPYVEIPEGYVSTKGLAEEVTDRDLEKVETSVKASNKKLIFALVGAGVGFGVAYYMKKGLKQKVIFTVGGVALGLFVDYINNRNKV